MISLRQYIRELLREEQEKKKLVGLGDIEPGTYGTMEDMALMVDSARYGSTYVLYKSNYYAQKIRRAITSAHDEYKSIRFKNEEDFEGFYNFANVEEIFQDPKGVYGFLRVLSGRELGLQGSCNKANEVSHVSARKGYATFMYEIALLKHSPIMPDRDGVSENEKEMWDFFSKERKDVDKEPFRNEKGLHDKGESDCLTYGYKALDQSYEKEQSYHIENLTARHDMFLERMKKYLEGQGSDFIKGRIEEYLTACGKIFYEADIDKWVEK